MQSRSWMAAFTLAAWLVVLHQPPAQAAAEPVVNQVKLELQITGLGRNGCEVEIKPGHAGCEFPTVVKQVDGPAGSTAPGARTIIPLDPIMARSTNADHDCAFAITIREAGQPPKTFRRGIRLTPKPENGTVPVQTLTCYLPSPSLAAQEKPSTPRR
jgi:hypothetical protein